MKAPPNQSMLDPGALYVIIVTMDKNSAKYPICISSFNSQHSYDVDRIIICRQGKSGPER